jgi:Fe-S cluster assembly protein SufD
MSTASEKSAWMNRLLSQGTKDLPVETLPWLRTQREDALNDLAVVEFPHRKQERWRYTPTDGLMKQDFVPSAKITEAPDDDQIRKWFTPGLDAYRLVFINGCCCPGYCEIKGLPEGVRMGSLRAAMTIDEALVSEHLGAIQQKSGELFGLLNQAMLSDGLFIHIDESVFLDKPIEVIYLSQVEHDSVLAQPRGLIVMEPGSKARVIERFACDEDSLYFNNTQTEIVIMENAELDHYRVQDESTAAYHLGGIHVLQHEASHYESGIYSLGSSLARSEINVRYSGKHARTGLKGLYLVGDDQINDVHLDVIHNLPNCHSEEAFRGLLYGKGRAVFDGRIFVARDAQKTEAHLSNNNLMLNRDAEVDTKPQLEIYADDVKCSHGTTVGQIEDEQVFYLRSRGINEKMARAMLSMGFAAAVVEQIIIDELQQDVLARISSRVSNALNQDS